MAYNTKESTPLSPLCELRGARGEEVLKRGHPWLNFLYIKMPSDVSAFPLPLKGYLSLSKNPYVWGFSINLPHFKIWTLVHLCPQVYEKGRELILLNSKNFFLSRQNKNVWNWIWAKVISKLYKIKWSYLTIDPALIYLRKVFLRKGNNFLSHLVSQLYDCQFIMFRSRMGSTNLVF